MEHGAQAPQLLLNPRPVLQLDDVEDSAGLGSRAQRDSVVVLLRLPAP